MEKRSHIDDIRAAISKRNKDFPSKVENMMQTFSYNLSLLLSLPFEESYMTSVKSILTETREKVQALFDNYEEGLCALNACTGNKQNTYSLKRSSIWGYNSSGGQVKTENTSFMNFIEETLKYFQKRPHKICITSGSPVHEQYEIVLSEFNNRFLMKLRIQLRKACTELTALNHNPSAWYGCPKEKLCEACGKSKAKFIKIDDKIEICTDCVVYNAAVTVNKLVRKDKFGGGFIIEGKGYVTIQQLLECVKKKKHFLNILRVVTLNKMKGKDRINIEIIGSKRIEYCCVNCFRNFAKGKESHPDEITGEVRCPKWYNFWLIPNSNDS